MSHARLADAPHVAKGRRLVFPLHPRRILRSSELKMHFYSCNDGLREKFPEPDICHSTKFLRGITSKTNFRFCYLTDVALVQNKMLELRKISAKLLFISQGVAII